MSLSSWGRGQLAVIRLGQAPILQAVDRMVDAIGDFSTVTIATMSID
jgi:hypothetical protein